MSSMKDIEAQALIDALGYRCMTACTLAINAASAATIKTTGTTTYLSDGKFKTKAALAAQAFSSGMPSLAIGQTGFYVVCLDSAGTVTTYGRKSILPDIPAGQTPIGYIKVVATSAAFVPGTTALDAAGLTVTFTDVSVLPATP